MAGGECQRRSAGQAAWERSASAGSDAHTIAGVGLTYTEVPGVRTVDEFLAGLRAGRGIVHGVHGSYAKLTADVYRIMRSFFGEKPWTLPLLPLTALVPAITAGHWLNEMRFCRKWSAELESEGKAAAHAVEAGFAAWKRIWPVDVRAWDLSDISSRVRYRDGRRTQSGDTSSAAITA